MSVFTDYAAKMRQLKTPFDAPAQIQPISTPSFAPVTVEQPQLPQIDTENAINSFAEILGPTPAEREARERRALESKAKMAAWAGLFDGFRQFGNLYSVYKGATPQQLSSPYQAIDQQVNEQRAIADANDNYRRQYAQSLYNFRRQMSDDARRDMLANAQADYYGTRDEVARMKAENDRQKAEIDRLKREAEIRGIDARTNYTNERTVTEKGVNREVKMAQAQHHRQSGLAAMTRANKAGKSSKNKDEVTVVKW